MKWFGWLSVSVQSLLVFPCLHAAAAGQELPRRPFVGVQVEAKLGQVTIARIFSRSSAARSQLRVGDAVLAIDETQVKTVSDFLSTMRRYRTGDRVRYRITRENAESVVQVALTEWPREEAAGIDVLYDRCDAGDALLRCVVTKPKGTTPGRRLPAVLYIQGIDCASIEAPFDAPNPMRDLVYQLTRSGFVVMRCEKRAVGDSTGRPCDELGLHEEVSGFVSALKKLKSYEFVDSEKIFLFGHSAGGWVAPMVASREPVHGVIVYGTVARSFPEYLVENRRRNQRLRTDRAHAEIEDEVRQLSRLLHYLLVEKRELAEVLKDHPGLRGAAAVVFPGEQSLAFGVRSLRYFREVADQNMPAVWAGLGIPVLALVGEYEIRTTAFEHEYIADIVNASRPGTGTWKQIPRMDHGLTLHTSLKQSAENEFNGPFGQQVVLEAGEWMQRVLAERS
jgi:pimeloyl-ACP methyl ester carboxylesterase